jgi:hypothetical protein
MRRFLSVFVVSLCLLSLPAYGIDPYISPDGVPYANLGGIIVSRQGDVVISSIGGGPIPRHIKVTTPVVPPPAIPFQLPAALPGVNQPPFLNCAPALLRVGIPDKNGLVYIEGELYRSAGTSRQFQSPPLLVGRNYPLHIRVAFKVGDNLLIEEKEVLIRPAVESVVSFDGSRALTVPLTPRESELPFPRKLND